MAGRIRLLGPELVNQIAAGEVVERPASAVKELCDNALDAGARRVFVDIEAGGRRLLRVSDDGVGMSREDARLALARHATSKLTRVEELHTLNTLGFRGEALPAIAAVSRFALTTREAGADVVAGWRVEVEAGVEGEAREVGAPPGTTVEVRDLYFNVPARLKFLKSDATEAAHVADVVLRLAMAHPRVHFRLSQGGRVVLEALPVDSGDLGERVRALLGPRLAARLWEAPAPLQGDPVRVRAFLAPPDEALASAKGVLLFVGRRAVRDRGLLHAVTLAYQGLLAPGRHAQAVVFVDVEGADVDVNVHPQKAEVRFARPGDVYAAVRQTLVMAIADAGWREEAEAAAEARGEETGDRQQVTGDREQGMTEEGEPRTGADGWMRASRAAWGARRETGTGTGTGANTSTSVSTTLGELEPLAIVEGAFVLARGAGELVLVDVAAARVEVARAELEAALAARRLRPQRTLFAEEIAADPALVGAAGTHAAALLSLGFELAVRGPTRLALVGTPAGFAATGATALAVLTLLAQGASVVDALGPLAARAGAGSGASAGAAPTLAEARTLCEALERTPWQRPRERPLLVRVALDELTRRFGPR